MKTFAWKGSKLIKKGKFSHYFNLTGLSFVFAVLMSALLSLGLLNAKMAANGGLVFLRTTMPSAPLADTQLPAPEEGDGVLQSQVDSQLPKADQLQPQNPEPAPEVMVNEPQWRLVRMRVTAYCPCEKCCGRFADGITACNHKIQPGDVFVAADKTYRFGTEIVIPGYNMTLPVKVLDRGGAIKGNRLDVFFPTHQRALEWGVRELDVLVRDN